MDNIIYTVRALLLFPLNHLDRLPLIVQNIFIAIKGGEFMGRGNGGRSNNAGQKQPNFDDKSNLSESKQKKVEK